MEQGIMNEEGRNCSILNKGKKKGNEIIGSFLLLSSSPPSLTSWLMYCRHRLVRPVVANYHFSVPAVSSFRGLTCGKGHSDGREPL
jgi:hypothetical protein